MSAEPPGQATAHRSADLLNAADVLLSTRSCLRSIRVLHGQVEQAIHSAAESALPREYDSVATAREYHDKLSKLIFQGNAPKTSEPPLRVRLRTPLHHVRRIGLPVLFAALLLRYAWSVSRESTWARQHPEGNWVSRYYPNNDFTGLPLVRYDTGVNHDFGADAPANNMNKDGFSARWDTCLVIRRETVVHLSLRSDDTSRLLLDGAPLVEIGPQPGVQAATLSLLPGMRQLRVEFSEAGGVAAVRLDGFELGGTEDYLFKRPSIHGTEVRCN